MAPSTLGTFLRAFTFGHVRQLDAVIAETIRRAWSLGAGPGDGADDDRSGLDDLRGARQAKHGAAYGYTKVLGYHPLLATRADTGEVLHARLRKGSSQRGAQALRRRAHRPGPPRRRHRRVDGARRRRVLVSYALIDTLDRLGVGWSITVRINPSIRKAIDAIDESAWTAIAYPDGGQAQVAETTYVTGSGNHRRASCAWSCAAPGSPTPPKRQLWPDWRHHAFITNVELPTVAVDQFHRDHATVELAIRDLKEGAGLEHCPSGPVLRQRRLARLRRARPQPDPLDRPPRRRAPRRSAHRHPHHPHPAPRAPRPARQPQPTTGSCGSPPAGHGPTTFNTALDRIRSLPLLT